MEAQQWLVNYMYVLWVLKIVNLNWKEYEREYKNQRRY